jgi:hypothetical protein
MKHSLIHFDDPKPNAVAVSLEWEKVSVPFQVRVTVNEIVQASLHNQLRG